MGDNASEMEIKPDTHECRECGQDCDCVADICCHPDTAECGVSQNFEDLPDYR